MFINDVVEYCYFCSQSIHSIRFHCRLSIDSVELCAVTSDRERSTRAREACNSDSDSCLCERSLTLAIYPARCAPYLHTACIVWDYLLDTGLLEWISEHAVRAYTTAHSAVSYVNHARIRIDYTSAS